MKNEISVWWRKTVTISAKKEELPWADTIAVQTKGGLDMDARTAHGLSM
jgi:hypothetical protein